MVEEEADKKEISELQMQLEILRALYGKATNLLEVGERDDELKESLILRGYGEWTLDNVYAFVYEASVDMPVEEHHSFLGEIWDTDFERLLAGSVRRGWRAARSPPQPGGAERGAAVEARRPRAPGALRSA